MPDPSVAVVSQRIVSVAPTWPNVASAPPSVTQLTSAHNRHVTCESTLVAVPASITGEVTVPWRTTPSANPTMSRVGTGTVPGPFQMKGLSAYAVSGAPPDVIGFDCSGLPARSSTPSVAVTMYVPPG